MGRLTVRSFRVDGAELAIREHVTTAGARLLLRLVANNLKPTERMRHRPARSAGWRVVFSKVWAEQARRTSGYLTRGNP